MLSRMLLNLYIFEKYSWWSLIYGEPHWKICSQNQMTSYQRWRNLHYFGLKMQKSREWLIQSWQTIPLFLSPNHDLFNGGTHFTKQVDQKIDVVRGTLWAYGKFEIFISREPLIAQSSFYAHFNRKMIFLLSVSYIIYV